MTCCMKRSKKVEKRFRRNAIHPINNPINIKNIDIPVKDYVEKINDECIVCHHCKQKYKLSSNEIKINCAECNKFFHCHIAGKCRGSDCMHILECESTYKEHRLSYCLDCVNPITVKNYTCLCNECK